MNEKLKTEREKMHGLEMWNDHRQGNSVLITSETENKLSLAGSQLLKSTENPEISTSKQDGQGKRILQIHASQKKEKEASRLEQENRAPRILNAKPEQEYMESQALKLTWCRILACSHANAAPLLL